MAIRDKNPGNDKHYIYDRRSGRKINVSDEIYAEYYRELWRQRKQAQSQGRCLCPFWELWKCDDNCTDCPHRADGMMMQLDDDNGEVSMSTQRIRIATPEEEYEATELYGRLRRLLEKLDARGGEILDLLCKELPDSTIAKKLGRPQRTFASQMERYRREMLKIINGNQ